MVNYRRANFEDNKGLLELTSEAGMDGDISLRIDRHPDFFKLLELRGETAVFVAEENDRIIGSLCVSTQDVYIDQKICPVNYIGDFKVALSARNRGIGLELTNTVAKWLMEKDADLVFLNVSKGNTRPFTFFT
ncbi:GNAT family N-acetyltransferase, partial [uncultured Eudoraea sp.]|uniref:GNAT family N-acetyltransferase n=1 Tax=uncultured Eudoraea sp. TaxID=1035614 RepID=UPI00261AA43E